MEMGKKQWRPWFLRQSIPIEGGSDNEGQLNHQRYQDSPSNPGFLVPLCPDGQYSLEFPVAAGSSRES